MNVTLTVPTGAQKLFLADGTIAVPSATGVVTADSKYLPELLRAGCTVYDPIFTEDFVSADGTIATTATAGIRWVRTMLNNGAVSYPNDLVGGVMQMALTAASEKQEASIHFGGQRQFSLERDAIFEARVKLTVLPTGLAQAFFGLAGDWADGPDTIQQSAWFAFSASGEALCQCDDNSTDTSATSGITLTADTWRLFRIDATDRTNIKFHIDGVRVASGTTFSFAATGANAVLQPYLGVYKASGTGVGTAQVDWIKIYNDRV